MLARGTHGPYPSTIRRARLRAILFDLLASDRFTKSLKTRLLRTEIDTFPDPKKTIAISFRFAVSAAEPIAQRARPQRPSLFNRSRSRRVTSSVIGSFLPKRRPAPVCRSKQCKQPHSHPCFSCLPRGAANLSSMRALPLLPPSRGLVRFRVQCP